MILRGKSFDTEMEEKSFEFDEKPPTQLTEIQQIIRK
jgi:hypothetical protein